jgi:hypothetical protein
MKHTSGSTMTRLTITRTFASAWLILGLATLPALATANPAAEPGYKPIFNGTSLEGWTGDARFWRVENGAIVGETTPDNPARGNTFLIWDQGEVDDFEIKLRFRMPTEYANSGVQIRSVRHDTYVIGGYQPDLSNDNWTGVMYEERGRGMLALRGETAVIAPDGTRTVARWADGAELLKEVNLRGWNDYHITARGPHIVVRVNGLRMSEIIDLGPEARLDGLLAFQLHAGAPMRIEIKDVELRRLPLSDERKKVVFVAGTPSHGYGNHEHRAGCLLLARLLDENTDHILSTVYTNGWPKDPTAFDNADAVVMFSNGGGGHMVVPHLHALHEVMKRGVGLGAIHYAVEVPKGEPGDLFLRWIGGYFETDWSVNPHWTANFEEIPCHACTRGVEPIEIYDEWYYHMRFADDQENITPIFSALPPAESLKRSDGPHSGNPHVRAAVLERKEKQHLMWTYQRGTMPGRGFGITGAHYHWNWAHPDFRTAVLNAIVWITGTEVAEGGIRTPAVTLDDLLVNQDYERPANFNLDPWLKRFEAWHQKP